MKAENNIDALYEKLEGEPIHVVERHEGGKNVYQCPVCKKKAKTVKGAKTHMQKAQCIDMKAIYTGTTIEYHGFGLYKTIVAAFTPNSRLSFSTFSNGKLYSPTMRVMTIVRYYGLYQHLTDYIGFIMSKHNPKHANQVMSYASKAANIEEFKVVMHGLDLINGAQYIEREYVNMKQDPLHFLRSLERCKFGLMEVTRSEELSALVEKLDEYPEYQERFYDLVEKVTNYQQGRVS